MVNNFTNINKTNNHQIIEHNNNQDIWRWKSKYCLKTGTTTVAWLRFIVAHYKVRSTNNLINETQIYLKWIKKNV
jgi:hypothetical protein